MNAKLKAIATIGMFALTTTALAPSGAIAENGSARAGDAPMSEERIERRREASETLNDAIATAERMTMDEDLDVNLSDVKGIFVIPNYARAAIGVGAAGGEGVLFVRDRGNWQATNWSQPMFYNIGAISVGPQVGVEAGEIAMLLMTEESVDTFMQENNFSLNADAGLTLIDYSERSQATAGKGDIVIWSDTAGVFVDLAINVEDIFWDDEENAAYYGHEVDPETVLMEDIGAGLGEDHPLDDLMN